MARDYRTLKLEILAETKQFVADMKNSETQVEGFGGKMEKFGKVAAAAFAAAAAAAVAYAGKLAIEGVQAAIEDEAAQNRLANALKNVTGATNSQIKAVEDQILQMSLAYGIADDQLRPAYQRLATATGSLEESNKALGLALDISAATGKSVEAVANALAKAYEGNTGALGRLGIGLSTAEMKSLGLDGTMQKLAETFGGAATVQANTLEGQIARLKVTFDEAKESVGQGLLPIVKSLMDYFVNTLIPKFIEAKDKAIAPIIQAFKDNEGAMRTLWNFGKTYLVPFFENTLFKAIEGVGKAIGGIITVVGFVMREVEKLVNAAISGINAVLSAYNAIPFLGNVGLLDKVNLTGSSQTNTSLGSRPLGGQVSSTISGNTSVSSSAISTPTAKQSSAVAAAAAAAGTAIGGSFNAGSFRLGEAATMAQYNITVNGALDPSAVANQINNILKNETTVAGNYSGGIGSSRFVQALQ